MKLTPIRIFLVIILLTILAAIVAAGGFLWNGKGEIRLFDRSFPYDFTLRRGLDLQGGLQLVLEAEMSGVSSADRPSALESARAVIERRVDFLGVAEPTVQTSRLGESFRIIVELPGVTNPEEALALIGSTAQLDFREAKLQPEDTEGQPFREGDNFVTTGLTGKDLAKADLQFDSTNGNPQIGLTFTAAGAKKFEEITARNIGQPLAIFLDGAVLSAPTVQGKISGGSAVITGTFTLEEARRFVAQLNAGALPTPISVLERRQIGPTLGEQELQKSVVGAGASEKCGSGIGRVGVGSSFHGGKLWPIGFAGRHCVGDLRHSHTGDLQVDSGYANSLGDCRIYSFRRDGGRREHPGF